jgi:antitoxin component of RelBE/YafQ-DinJ toxin-antitoxin module
MNVTLSIDERVLGEALRAAGSMGLALNQAVRQYLEELAGRRSAVEDIRELDELSARSGTDSPGWKFNRDESHQRS